MVYLVTTPTCLNCPKAKTFLLEKNLSYELMDAGTAEGLQFARKYEVAHVPTLLEIDQDHRIIRKLSGLQEIFQAF